MKTSIEALLLGIIGALAVYTGGAFQLPVWVIFLAWISFNLTGGAIELSLKIFIQQVIGILLAVGVQYCNKSLLPLLGDYSLPLIMCIVNILLVFISKTKKLNSIPAYFSGMIIWFASQSEPRFLECTNLVIAIAVGFFFGWINKRLNKYILEKYE